MVPSVLSSGSTAAPVIPSSSWTTGNMPRTNTAWPALVKASSVHLWTSNISAPTMKPLSTACRSSGWTIPMGCSLPLSGQPHHDAGGQAPCTKLDCRRLCFDDDGGRAVSKLFVSNGWLRRLCRLQPRVCDQPSRMASRRAPARGLSTVDQSRDPFERAAPPYSNTA